MKKAFCLMALILSFLLLTSGCTSTATLPVPMASPSLTATSLPILPILTPTQRSTLVPTVTPDPSAFYRNLLQSCQKVQMKPPDGFQFHWDLLVHQGLFVSKILSDNESKIAIPDFSQKSVEGFNKYNTQFFISPDGKWLAYQSADQITLFVDSTETLTDPQKQHRLVWTQGEKTFLRRWVTNDTLLLFYWKSSSDSFITSLILNPFTGERHEFSVNMLPEDFFRQRWGGAVLATHYWTDGDLSLDPTQTLAVYPVLKSDYIYSVLWNIERREKMAQLRYYFGINNDPIWSLDGNDFVQISFANDWLEWFQVTRDGKIRQLTHFGDFMKPTENYYFSLPDRSVDGRYLSFQLVYNDPGRSPKYIILDLQTGGGKSFCVDSVEGVLPALVWSPDNKYLLISDLGDQLTGPLILVDVDRQEAYQVSADVEAIGFIEKQ